MKLWKKTIALLLAVLMLLGASPVLAADVLLIASNPNAKAGVSSTGYTDVKVGGYYEAPLAALMAAGAALDTDGDGKFNPNAPATRATFVEWLWRIAGAPKASKAAAFSDVAAAASYADAVAWAVENGVTTGYSDGTFRPDATVTRAQMMTFLYRYAKEVKGYKNVEKQAAVTSYSDIAAVPNHAKNSIPWALEIGIMQGTADGTLNPNGTATRAHAAAFMGRLMEAVTVTRADMEEAIVEAAWAYYMKRHLIQYESYEMDPFGKNNYGQYRLTERVSPEYGTEDNTIFTVCADWTAQVVYEALDFALFDGTSMDCTTTGMWRFCENQPYSDPADDIDACIARWYNPNEYKFDDLDRRLGVDQSKSFVTDVQFRDIVKNYETMLRPGDIIVADAHALMYIGNGYVLDCSDGDKYNMDLGVDRTEPEGTIYRPRSVVTTFTDLEVGGSFVVSNSNSNCTDAIIMRPTEFLVVSDDVDANGLTDGIANDGTDGDLGNDPAKDGFTMPISTKTRLENPGMEIQRTVDISPYGTAAAGETLTYTVQISNKSNETFYTNFHTYAFADAIIRSGGNFIDGIKDGAVPAFDYAPKAYEGLSVVETIPEGTEFVSATAGGKKTNNIISWELDIAPGEVKTVSYTVKVTAPMGSTIVSDGGRVGNIPSNSISNKVGGTKINAAAQQILSEIAATPTAEWREKYNISAWAEDIDFAERLYQVMGLELGLNGRSLQDIVYNVFPREEVTQPGGPGYAYLGNDETHIVHVLNDEMPAEYQDIADMLIDTYYGGYYTYKGRNLTIDEFKNNYLEPGDILVFADTTATGSLQKYRVIVAAGNDTLINFGPNGKIAVWDTFQAIQLMNSAFTWDLYFALRPSQAQADINKAVFTGTAPVYPAGEPVDDDSDKPTERGTTTLSDSSIAALQTLTGKGWSTKYGDFIVDVYDVMGIDLSNIFGGVTVASGIFGEIFSEFAKQNTYNKDYLLAPVKDTTMDYMLIPGFYGPPSNPGDDSFMLDEPGVILDPTMDMLQPGDILITCDYESACRCYWVMVYQGDGKFVCNANHTDPDVHGIAGLKKYNWTQLDLSSGTEATYGITFEQLLTTEPMHGGVNEYYFALRPTLGVYDIYNVNYKPSTVQVEKDGKPEPISDEIAAKLAALTPADAKATGERQFLCMEALYKKAGLNINDVTGGRTVVNQVNKLFMQIGSTGVGYYMEPLYELPAGSEAVEKILIKESIRGTNLSTEGMAGAGTFGYDDLQPGDIIGLAYKPTKSYWVGLYQGNGKILFACYDGSFKGETFLGDTNSGNYYYQWDINVDNAKYGDILTYAPTVGQDWEFSIVFRPANAYEDINLEAAIK